MDYFGNIIPRESLIKEVYSKCNIFLYPTFCDSLGYSLIDALVAKLPIISTNLFAVPAMVEDGKNGFIIKIPGYELKEDFSEVRKYQEITKEDNKKIVQNRKRNIEKLVKNKKQLEKMSGKSFRKVEEGKF